MHEPQRHNQIKKKKKWKGYFEIAHSNDAAKDYTEKTRWRDGGEGTGSTRIRWSATKSNKGISIAGGFNHDVSMPLRRAGLINRKDGTAVERKHHIGNSGRFSASLGVRVPHKVVGKNGHTYFQVYAGVQEQKVTREIVNWAHKKFKFVPRNGENPGPHGPVGGVSVGHKFVAGSVGKPGGIQAQVSPFAVATAGTTIALTAGVSAEVGRNIQALPQVAPPILPGAAPLVFTNTDQSKSGDWRLRFQLREELRFRDERYGKEYSHKTSVPRVRIDLDVVPFSPVVVGLGAEYGTDAARNSPRGRGQFTGEMRIGFKF